MFRYGSISTYWQLLSVFCSGDVGGGGNKYNCEITYPIQVSVLQANESFLVLISAIVKGMSFAHIFAKCYSLATYFH
jgi:hypothetical protein